MNAKLNKILSTLDTPVKKLQAAFVLAGVLFLLAVTVPIARQILSTQIASAANVKHWWCKQTGQGDWHVIPPSDRGGPNAAEFETNVLFVPGGDKPSDSICTVQSPTATPVVVFSTSTPVVVVPTSTQVVVNPTPTNTTILVQPTVVEEALETPSPCLANNCPCIDEWRALITQEARQADALERIADALENQKP